MTITSTLSLPPYLYFVNQTHCFIIITLLLFIATLSHWMSARSFRSRKQAVNEGPLFVAVEVRKGLRGLRYVGASRQASSDIHEVADRHDQSLPPPSVVNMLGCGGKVPF